MKKCLRCVAVLMSAMENVGDMVVANEIKVNLVEVCCHLFFLKGAV
jgi:hypothetical protein